MNFWDGAKECQSCEVVGKRWRCNTITFLSPFLKFTLPGDIHVLLYFMYRVLYYSTTCYNPATGCYMIINNNS